MHIDPILPVIVGSAFIAVMLIFIFRLLRQPQILAYIAAGVIIGPQVLGMISDPLLIEQLGSLGVILLLFFIGMEIDPQQLKKSWKVSIGGTFLQVVFSVAAVYAVGFLLDWSIARIVLLGFVISLTSTAVIITMMKDQNELHSQRGQHVLGITLAQDLAVIPMIIILGLLSDKGFSLSTLLLQLFGGGLIILIVIKLMSKKLISIPILDVFSKNYDLQVFGALIFCFGLSLISGLMALSTAFGAFLGGMVVGNIKQTHWVKGRLEAFHVVFVALFFMSIGMLLNLSFVAENWLLLLGFLLLILVGNTLINAITLRVMRVNWRDSFYAGAVLAQIGEFSFILASIGKHSHIITDFGYQMTISAIALSLLASPVWTSLFRFVTTPKVPAVSK